MVCQKELQAFHLKNHPGWGLDREANWHNLSQASSLAGFESSSRYADVFQAQAYNH